MKPKTVFICQECGRQSPKWLGRCPGCGGWSTLIEEKEEAPAAALDLPESDPVLFGDVRHTAKERWSSGMEELDTVLGGGIVPGSLILIGGEPGIGKSTLLLQFSRDFSRRDNRVLYVSGEESLEQIKLRGDRLGVGAGALYLLAETNCERFLAHADKIRPQVLVIDSIQTVFSAGLSSGPGSISQVRDVTNQIFRFSKTRGIPAFLVGHITKDGSLAGPKTLEHMVDVVLTFEGERDHSHRVLRALKNRFGPVSELAIFEMTGSGLSVIPNPSAFFLKERPETEAGSSVVCTFKGSRPLLAEIQALVSSTLFSGNPRRMTIGLDHFRASMLLAVIEKKLGFSFAGQDVYLNVAGGLQIDEPGVDLAAAAAVVSSLGNKPIPVQTAIFGEIGLSGEIRSVNQPLLRAREAAAMGFQSVICPAGNVGQIRKESIPGIDLKGVKSIKEAMDYMF